MQRSKIAAYSITSSARASSVVGTSRPGVFLPLDAPELGAPRG